MKLSVVIPVYNEEATVAAAVKSVLDVDYPCEMEVVLVDDGSTDGTWEKLAAINNPRLAKHTRAVNQGKGAAVRTAAKFATGDYIVPCDADLEYSPEEIPDLLRPIVRGDATVVFGSRTFGSHSAYSYWYVIGNKAITTAANMLFNSYISDLETCSKLMPLELYRSLDVRSAGFGLEAEIAGKLLHRGIRPYEVPISYWVRSVRKARRSPGRTA